MDSLRISAVSYLNTYPFVFGLRESGMLPGLKLELDVPSVCADKLRNRLVDIALVPAGALPEIAGYRIVSDYCIGATGPVKTVLLLSKKPVGEIRRIHLDFDSRTSVELIKVLARDHWHITPEWSGLRPGEAESDHDLEALVAIGDKTFHLRNRYPYVYDLAENWIAHTGLPFVFAVWVTQKDLPFTVTEALNRALAYGVDRKRETIDYFREKLPPTVDCLDYLENNISYPLDEIKRQGLEKFLDLLTGKMVK